MFYKVLLTGLAAAALVLAQGGGMGGGGMGGGGRVQKPSKGEQFADKLKLNKGQKSQAQAILEAKAKDAMPVAQQLAQARTAYARALVNNKSQADLDKLYQAMVDSQEQLTGIEAKAFQQVVAILKPNQTGKAAEAFDLLAGIFEPQETGRGGSGGGRGEGGGGRSGGGGRGAGGGGR